MERDGTSSGGVISAEGASKDVCEGAFCEDPKFEIRPRKNKPRGFETSRLRISGAAELFSSSCGSFVIVLEGSHRDKGLALAKIVINHEHD